MNSERNSVENDLTSMFGGLPQWPSFEDMMANESDLERLKGRMEPWMSEFVKEKHSLEDWEAFFYYCEAGPLKRLWIQVWSVFLSIFHPYDRGTS